MTEANKKRENGRQRFCGIAFDLASSETYPQIAAALLCLRHLRKDTDDMIHKLVAANVSPDCIDAYIVPIDELDEIIEPLEEVRFERFAGERRVPTGRDDQLLFIARRKAQSIVGAWV